MQNTQKDKQISVQVCFNSFVNFRASPLKDFHTLKWRTNFASLFWKLNLNGLYSFESVHLQLGISI